MNSWIYKFARPWPRACQIMDYVLLTFTFSISSSKFSKNLKWKQNKTDFRDKKQARATIPWICARTVVSCWKSAHARGAVREPRESIIVCRDLLGRALFSYLFLASFFSTKIEIYNENGPQNGPKVDTFGICFQKTKENRKVRFDCTGAYGLHMSPHRGKPRATQNYTKKQTDSRNFLFFEKSENIQKVTPKRSPNGWLYFSLTSLWRPLGHHWCPSPFFNTKNEPKVLPKCHRSWKVLQKVTQKDPKSSKNLEKQRFLYLAWRTARSAYNK